MTELSANQKKALEALLTTPSVAAAARRCGLGTRTVWRYMADDGFKAELRERRDLALTSVTTGLIVGSSHASEALWAILYDPEASRSVKARVAATLLREMGKSVQLEDLTDRVAALEELAGGRRDLGANSITEV